MARKQTHPIGHVVPFGTGFSAYVERYPSGRKLPQARYLLMPDGRPFATAHRALEGRKTTGSTVLVV